MAVHVSGDCLKALCFAVSYDQTRWHFAGISPGPAFGTDALTLAADPAPGMVHCGLVLPRFDELSGFSGNSTAAVLTFEPGPPAQQVKSFSAQHAETGVSWDAGSNSLRWGYGVQGDYDQNGEVGIADITPLGRYFGDVGPFASADVRGVIDGDGNGELNISDLTPLGINFGLHCEGYGVYFAQSEQNLPLAGVADDHNLLRATTALSQASGPAATQRLEFSSPFGAAAPNGWVWVRPLLAAGVGPPSNVLRLGSSETQNAWPAAQISANLVSGPAPLAVSFDAAASTDPDGTIVSYEWDWTGGSDGWVWQSSGADAAALHVYSVEGSYTATVRATDDEGATGFAALVVNVQVGNLPPTGVLEGPDEVLEMQYSHFRVEAAADPDGQVTGYDWDMHGDGAFEETGGSEFNAHSLRFREPGIYHPTVLLHDDGGATTLLTATVVVIDDPAPVLTVTAQPLQGTAPHTVTFDITGSGDLGPGSEESLGHMLWDFGDGITAGDYMWHQPTVVQHRYLTGGLYTCTISLEDEASQVTTQQFVVELAGPQLHESVLPGDWTGDVSSAALINGRPALVYDSRDWDSEKESNRVFLSYIAAQDPLGEAWLPPVLIAEDLGAFAAHCSLAEVQGLPAVCYYSDGDSAMYYSRALSPLADQWSTPVQLKDRVSVFGGGPCSLQVIGAAPAISFSESTSLCYTKALDPLGDAWTEPVVVAEGSFAGWPCSLLEVGGNPAIGYSTLEGPCFVRAADAQGDVWPASVKLGTNYFTPLTCSLLFVQGHPAVCIGGAYARALDELGEQWPELTWLYPTFSPSSEDQAAVIGGIPMAASVTVDHQALLLQAGDELGEAWEFPAELGSEHEPHLLDLGGIPGIFLDNRFITIY